jgi:hypothetical protein
VARLRFLAPEQVGALVEVDGSIRACVESKLSALDIVQNVAHSAQRAHEDPSLPLVDLINPLLENLNVIRFVPTLVQQVENTEGLKSFVNKTLVYGICRNIGSCSRCRNYCRVCGCFKNITFC